MALLPVHSQNYSRLRKRSFKRACRAATVKQQPVYYRGQVLTPTQVRRSGNCPPLNQREPHRSPGPRAGLANRAIRVLSHLGQQQGSEVKSWLLTEAQQMCDVLVLQETQWKEIAEFSASGWYCVTSASAEDAVSTKQVTAGGIAQRATKAEASLQIQKAPVPL